MDLFFTHYIWILQCFLIVLCTIIFVYLERFFYRFLLPRVEGTPKLWDKELLEAAHPPIVSAIWLFGLSFAVEWGSEYLQHPLLDAFPQFVREMGIAFFFIWFLVRFIRGMENALLSEKNRRYRMDKTSVQAVCQILRLSVLITGALVLLRAFGVPLSGVVAFAGAGGLSIGFAAKDVLANFFGGLMIFLDRPFKLGDWIRSPDKEIEGTVEKIGWRLTRIRTFDKRPLFVPNALFSTIAVENASRMKNRRIKAVVGVRYQDAKNIRKIVSEVEEMLRTHAEIDWSQTSFVNLIHFGSYSLDFMIYAFTKTTDWIRFQRIQEEVFLRTIDIILENGAECALPSTTLHVPGALHVRSEISG
ncbi:MAG: mechanosensitive ion channel family protein [Chlamydiota bacterium]